MRTMQPNNIVVKNRTSLCLFLALCEVLVLKVPLFLLEGDCLLPQRQPSSCWLKPSQSKAVLRSWWSVTYTTNVPWYQLPHSELCGYIFCISFNTISRRISIQQFLLLPANLLGQGLLEVHLSCLCHSQTLQALISSYLSFICGHLEHSKKSGFTNGKGGGNLLLFKFAHLRTSTLPGGLGDRCMYYNTLLDMGMWTQPLRLHWNTGASAPLLPVPSPDKWGGLGQEPSDVKPVPNQICRSQTRKVIHCGDP